MRAGIEAQGLAGGTPSRPVVTVHGLLLLVTVALPLALTVLMAWFTWRGTWHEAEGEMQRDAVAVAEFAGRVLDGYRQALERVATMLHGLSTEAIEARAGEFILALRDLQAGLPDIDAIAVAGRDGQPLLGSLGPEAVPPALLAMLRTAPQGNPSIMPLPAADGRPATLALALGTVESGGALGSVALTLRADKVAARLARFSTGSEDAAALVTLDGRLLARAAPPTAPAAGSRPAPDAPAARALRAGLERWSGRGPSPHDSVERLTALRRVPGFPVYVIVARPADRIAAEWRAAIVLPALVALASATLLAALALLVQRSQRTTLEANARLEQRVAARTVEVAQAMAAMRVGDERLRLAIEAAGFGTWELELPDGRITRSGVPMMNLEALPLSGFTFAAYLEHVFPEDRERVRAAVAELADGTAERSRAEYRVRRADGSRIWVESYGGVIERDAASGVPRRLAGVSRDVTDRRQAEAMLGASEARLRVAIEAARFSTWEYDVRTDRGLRQGELAKALPQVPESGFGLDDWLQQIHPADRDRMRVAIRGLIAGTQDRMVEEFRVQRPDGGWSSIESAGAIAERDATTGAVLRLAGVARDVTESRLAAERQALLAREVDHRAKNALAVVQAALRLTPRTDAASYAQAVEGRVRALARAHTLLAEARWEGASLHALASAELSAFLPSGPGGTPGRARIDGPNLTLAPPVAQGLSMVLHELATNAVKYGALSVASGSVTLAWKVDAAAAQLRLRWEERGGPALTEAPQRRGFGSRVVEATVRDQLGGALDRQWHPAGLLCRIDIPLARAMIGMADPGTATVRRAAE